MNENVAYAVSCEELAELHFCWLPKSLNIMFSLHGIIV